ncbi:2a979ef0-7a8e-4bab-a510-4b083c42e894 [Thermothielavioides terrestris]|uniref:2a979ef0-7a8e-4bab-a510-4b083c42e894 n=1 Tax=Thermothielavioides terrestris TaxID=2587410 RepID=A0A3S4BN56_9PEZI|nr:2a979ef0-7a8e-4bab-a510-4b083c42e894 [Thermothielavioides terrestris]
MATTQADHRPRRGHPTRILTLLLILFLAATTTAIAAAAPITTTTIDFTPTTITTDIIDIPANATITTTEALGPAFPDSLYDTPGHAIASGLFVGVASTGLFWAVAVIVRVYVVWIGRGLVGLARRGLRVAAGPVPGPGFV